VDRILGYENSGPRPSWILGNRAIFLVYPIRWTRNQPPPARTPYIFQAFPTSTSIMIRHFVGTAPQGLAPWIIELLVLKKVWDGTPVSEFTICWYFQLL